MFSDNQSVYRMSSDAELCDLTVDLLCLSQDLIHAKLRLQKSAKVKWFPTSSFSSFLA